MWISRVRVTGGFLQGLDVSLQPGLNVLVGPRGVGKTTLLELIRHAVGAQHAEQSSAALKQQSAFLSAILGSGDVVLDVEGDDGGRRLVVDAKGGGQRQDLAHSVLVLGQNELEEIASDAASRLKLLDLRTGVAVPSPVHDEVSELTGQLFDVRAELVSRNEETHKRQTLQRDLDLLQAQEAALVSGNSENLTSQRELLRVSESEVIESGQELKRLKSVRDEIADIYIAQRRESDRIRSLSVASDKLSETNISKLLARSLGLSVELLSSLVAAQELLEDAQSKIEEKNVRAREAAEPVRADLEKAETGLGQLTSQLRNVETALRALAENDSAVEVLERRQAELVARRSVALDAQERVQEEVFAGRLEVARGATSQIAENVVVAVDHLADSTSFISFLVEALKGTGTRASLIDQIAESLLPLQLLRMVESGDAQGLATASNITIERAVKLIENLDSREILCGLSRVQLADMVDFRLRDGSVDKSVDELSTGQKCAVTLPIILSERQRTLILDQPEDHLDNAFLVANIVAGLRKRVDSGAQTIVATHNANVPVLGSADNVVVLTSDGLTGSVDVQGRFDERAVVDRITRIMEGGKEAFAQRSAFYAEHGGSE